MLKRIWLSLMEDARAQMTGLTAIAFILLTLDVDSVGSKKKVRKA